MVQTSFNTSDKLSLMHIIAMSSQNCNIKGESKLKN